MENTNKEVQVEKATLKNLIIDIKAEYKKEFSLSGLIRWAKNPNKGLKLVNSYNKEYAKKQGLNPVKLSVLSVRSLVNHLSYAELNIFRLDENGSLEVDEKRVYSINILIKGIERSIKGITFDENEEQINDIHINKAESLLKAKKQAELRAKYISLGKQAYKA